MSPNLVSRSHFHRYMNLNYTPDVTLQHVRLMMAEEEKARVEAGTGIIHDVSAGAFLLLGMEIQNLQ